MPDDRIVLHRVAWRQVCPWLMIFRCFRLAISLPIMFAATIGTLLMPCGEIVLRKLLISDTQQVPLVGMSPIVVEPPAGMPVPVTPRPPSVIDTWVWHGDDVRGVFFTFVRPVWNLFDRTATFSQFTFNSLLAIWYIAIWAFLGTAIARIAVVQLGRDERVTLSDALRHSARNYGWTFAAPLFPLLGVALFVIPLAILGLLMRLDAGLFLAGLIWPLVLLAGLIMAVLLLGLLGGWPLMWPTIAAEEASDAFEAFSRSYSYTFQRPLHYLFYVVVVVLLGMLGWLLVGNFADAVVALSHWGVSFGSGSGRVGINVVSPEEPSGLLRTGISMIAAWNWVVRRIAQAFNFGFFFCCASAIYLLLRRHVDQTDFDEVYVPDDATRYGLPPLRTGPEGIPEVTEAPPPATD